MNPPPSWSSETPPTPKSRTQGGSTAAAKDEQVAAPTSGWEAACSEGIHVGGNIEGEAAALAALKTHHSILYLSTDEGSDVAYKVPAGAHLHVAQLSTRGFEALVALDAGGVEVVRCPLRMDPGCSLTNDDAEVVDSVLLRLQRPTLIVSAHGWRACAVKALYIGRKAGLTHLTETLLEAAADDQYWPLTLIPDEAGEQQSHQPQQSSMAEWHKHAKLRRWVEEALAASAGPGTEAARVGGAAGIQGMAGEGI